MRRFFIYLTLVFLFLSCSQGYVQRGNLAPNFDTIKNYKTAILPFLVRAGDVNPPEKLQDRAYDQLQMLMMETDNFTFINKFEVEKAVRVHAFGGLETVDPALSCKIGKELGAELVVISELSIHPVGSGLPILANVQIIDVNTGNVVYSGRGRSGNFVNIEAGCEHSIDYAVDVLIKKLK